MHVSCLVLGLAGLGLFASGCAVSGGLGQVMVAEACPPDEPTCRKRGLDHPVARGATVRPELAFQLPGSGGLSVHFEATDPAVLHSEDGLVKGVGAGLSALLVVSDDGTVLDFFHVWVKDPSAIELRLKRGDALASDPFQGRLELLPGDSLRLSAALTGEGQKLAGDAPYEWKIEPPIAELLEEGSTGERRLVATKKGSAKLVVRALDLTRTVEIVVRDVDARLASKAVAQ